MSQPDYRNLVKQLGSGDPSQQTVAKMIIVSMEEDAVEGLVDEYFAGVTDLEGAAIIEVLSSVGGYEALNFLRQVFAHEQRTVLVRASAYGLLHNIMNLSQDEREAVASYLAQNN